MQRAAVRRLLTGFDLVGSAVLIAVPIAGKVSPFIAFPGAIGLILAAASLYWNSGDAYSLFVGVTSFMLFAAFAGWASALWSAYSNLGDTLALALTVGCVLVAVGFLLVTAVAGGFSKDQK
jgi:hypothetical protein